MAEKAALTSSTERPPKFKIRRASSSDLDAIVDIALQAMPLDPQWDWRFPYRSRFPEDERFFTALKFQEFLDSEDRWLVLLARDPHTTDAVGFAVWDLHNLYTSLGYDTSASELAKSNHGPKRRDADLERLQAWSSTTALAKKALFDIRYGTSYIQLQILATRPEWQRRGVGTALCHWGLELADLCSFSVAVFASPMGQLLYSTLGFDTMAMIEVRAGNEDERVVLQAMGRSRSSR